MDVGSSQVARAPGPLRGPRRASNHRELTRTEPRVPRASAAQHVSGAARRAFCTSGIADQVWKHACHCQTAGSPESWRCRDGLRRGSARSSATLPRRGRSPSARGGGPRRLLLAPLIESRLRNRASALFICRAEALFCTCGAGTTRASLRSPGGMSKRRIRPTPRVGAGTAPESEMYSRPLQPQLIPAHSSVVQGTCFGFEQDAGRAARPV